MGRRSTGAALVLLAPAAAVVLGTGPAAYPALAAPTSAPVPSTSTQAARAPAVVTLTGLTPEVARPGSAVTVTGLVSAVEALKDVRVRIFVRRSVTVRAQLANAADSTAPQGVSTVSVQLPDIAAGTRAKFTAVVPAASLAGGEDVAVRIVSVEVRAAPPGTGTQRVAIAQTFVPWAPATVVTRATRLAMVWPFSAPPQRDADGVFANGVLEQELAADGGRLHTLLDASAGWTLALDPMLAEDLAEMAKPEGYLLAQPTGKPVRQPASAAAAAALQTLRQRAAVPGAVTLLPYGDVDVVGLVSTRREGELRAAVQRAATVAAKVLGVGLHVQVALPQQGGPSAREVAALARAGVHAVVLPSSVVPADPEARFTPSARTTVSLGNGVTTAAVVSDSLLTDLVSGQSARVSSVARLLGETAMHTAELPSVPRALVIAPPRDWEPDPKAVTALQKAIDAAPWIMPTSLDAVAGEASTTTPVAVTAPPAATAPLSPTYLEQVSAHAKAGTAYSRILGTKVSADRLADAYAAERLRLESVAAAHEGSLMLARSDAVLRDRTRLISVVSNNRITIPGSQGFPLTVRNDSDQGVRVAVSFARTARLTVEPSKVIAIAAHTSWRIEVRTRATANGPVDVPTQLMTPTGRPFGEARVLHLTVRGAGGPAKLLVAIAGGVFVLALAARIFRRRRPAGTPDRDISVEGTPTA